MARLSRDGKRLVNKPVRHPVPEGCSGDLDAKAVQVYKLRQERDDLSYQVRWYDREAFKAGLAADTAVNPGLRKAEYERADRLKAKAGAAEDPA